MQNKKTILIVGAGPSGLSMGIFLSELGYKPKIIDKKNQISEYSKAIGVNPRTLEILDAFGITKRFLANGNRINAINLWKGDKLIYKNKFTHVNHKYPFMLVQSQKESEAILLDELQKRGINVEYGTEFESYERTKSQYSVSLNDGSVKTLNCNYIIGADGGESKVREQLNIKYKGFRYDAEWELYDIELDTELLLDEAHIRLFKEGGMMMVRLKENIWRVVGNMTSLLNYLPKRTKIGKIHWESKFRILHKVAESLVRENAVLIGDAAHLHSPIGARGMNLGIEDASISSKLIHDNRIQEYNGLRRAYLEKTVKRINNITTGVAGSSTMSRILRNQIGNLQVLFPIIMPKVQSFVLGLTK